jgi:POT family proton-dependent oligopeptide transporter
MSDSGRTEPDHHLTGYPPGVPYIIGNEGCERFSFYGMKAILYIYVVGLYLQLRGMDTATARSEATAATHMFVAAVYFVPLVGGIIADRLLGKYRTILYLSVVYCLGHLALAVFEHSGWQQELFGKVFIDPITGLYIGLGLISLGSGGIKPCVSAHVGDQFGKSNWHLLQKIFNAFYFIINFGSFFATIFIPIIRGQELWRVGEKVATLAQLKSELGLTVQQIAAQGAFEGYTGSVGWAFGIPGILMGIATIFFWMGRKVFIHVPPAPGGKLGLMDTVAGVSLFMVIGWPIFFGEVTSGWLPDLGIAIASFVVFVLVFSARQRIEQDDGFLAITFHAVRSSFGGERGPAPTVSDGASDDQKALAASRFWGPAVSKFGVEATEGPVAVLKIISVFLMVSVFWALFDQHSSTWIEQAKAMNLNVKFDQSGWIAVGLAFGGLIGGAFFLTFQKKKPVALGAFAAWAVGGAVAGFVLSGLQPDGGFAVQASQVPATNPILVMILIPYTTFGLYPLLAKLGIDPHPLRRMTLGMFMAALSFAIVALIQRAIDAGAAEGRLVHVGWQLIAYAVITLSEVMVSVTGLEFAYSQAPKRMKSVIMGFWLFNVTLGSLLVVLLAGFKGLSPETFFWVFAGLMSLAAVIFGVRAKFYRYKDYTQ